MDTGFARFARLTNFPEEVAPLRSQNQREWGAAPGAICAGSEGTTERTSVNACVQLSASVSVVFRTAHIEVY